MSWPVFLVVMGLRAFEIDCAVCQAFIFFLCSFNGIWLLCNFGRRDELCPSKGKLVVT